MADGPDELRAFAGFCRTQLSHSDDAQIVADAADAWALALDAAGRREISLRLTARVALLALTDRFDLRRRRHRTGTAPPTRRARSRPQRPNAPPQWTITTMQADRPEQLISAAAAPFCGGDAT
jgi:hypothetical protein